MKCPRRWHFRATAYITCSHTGNRPARFAPTRSTASNAAAPLGIKATRDVDALLALEADCVLYSSILGDATLLERILAQRFPYTSATLGAGTYFAALIRGIVTT